MLAVLECGRGRSKVDVARSLGVTRQSVHNWVCRYRCSGRPTALDDVPKSGCPRKADDVVEALVQALMMVSPERCGYHATHWTIPLLRDQVLGNLPHRSVVLAEDETDLLLFPPLRAMWSPRGVPCRSC